MASPFQAMQLAAAGTSIEELSRMGLPMSSVSSRASSPACLSMSSASFKRRRLRWAGAMRDHLPDSKARRAAATARSTSSLSQAAILAMTSPVAGLTQSKVCPEAASTYLPSMKACVRKVRRVASRFQSCADSISAMARLLSLREGFGSVGAHLSPLASGGQGGESEVVGQFHPILRDGPSALLRMR